MLRSQGAKDAGAFIPACCLAAPVHSLRDRTPDQKQTRSSPADFSVALQRARMRRPDQVTEPGATRTQRPVELVSRRNTTLVWAPESLDVAGCVRLFRGRLYQLFVFFPSTLWWWLFRFFFFLFFFCSAHSAPCVVYAFPSSHSVTQVGKRHNSRTSSVFVVKKEQVLVSTETKVKERAIWKA